MPGLPIILQGNGGGNGNTFSTILVGLMFAGVVAVLVYFLYKKFHKSGSSTPSSTSTSTSTSSSSSTPGDSNDSTPPGGGASTIVPLATNCDPNGFRIGYQDVQGGATAVAFGNTVDEFKNNCLTAGFCYDDTHLGQPPCYKNAASSWDGVRHRRTDESPVEWLERILRTMGGALGRRVDPSEVLIGDHTTLDSTDANKICCGSDLSACNQGACGPAAPTGFWEPNNDFRANLLSTRMCDCTAKRAINF